MADKVNPKLKEMFLYHLGVDLSEPKYDEFRMELADFVSKTVEESVRKFYSSPTKLI